MGGQDAPDAGRAPEDGEGYEREGQRLGRRGVGACSGGRAEVDDPEVNGAKDAKGQRREIGSPFWDRGEMPRFQNTRHQIPPVAIQSNPQSPIPNPSESPVPGGMGPFPTNDYRVPGRMAVSVPLVAPRAARTHPSSRPQGTGGRALGARLSVRCSPRWARRCACGRSATSARSHAPGRHATGR